MVKYGVLDISLLAELTRETPDHRAWRWC